MLTEKDFTGIQISRPPHFGFELEATAPSNIALVKYWGKHDNQLPMNPSISFTLNRSQTITKASLKPLRKISDTVVFRLFFEGKPKPEFEPKIAVFFQKIARYVPFIRFFEWEIDSYNTFPHSSGIASSASAFAALAKMTVDLERKLFHGIDAELLNKKASFLARLGSGSAARSIEHPIMLWGQHSDIPHSSDLYAVKPDFDLHSVFNNYQDSIILVEKGQKAVSSTAGHELMNRHPFKEIRKQHAFDNVLQMYNILQTGDLESFIRITEAEALELHALMMTSRPNYLLMQPETLEVIHQIRAIRDEKNIPVCFTLDAGANVHVLYPEVYRSSVQNLLLDNIDHDIIDDFV